MKGQKHNEWIWPPPGQWVLIWGGLMMMIIGLLASELVTFSNRLTGAAWISCYFSALAVSAVGVSLLFYAKLPLYRQRRFFTFGSRALPEQRRPFYRWGYRCVMVGVAILICLTVI